MSTPLINLFHVDRHPTHLATAIFLACFAHHGLFRKDGVTPYITHLEAVANAVPPPCKTVAWLHDILEDCPRYIDIDVLAAAGIPANHIEAVVALTKVPGEKYDDYLDRVLSNPLAVVVKIADIENNLSGNPTEKAKVKYAEALVKLKAKQLMGLDCGIPQV